MTNTEPYNPLAKENLGKSVAEAMLNSETMPLGDLLKFNGAGVYAIYYTGDFQVYQPISRQNQDGEVKVPIYVGKAVPPGARKGNIDTETEVSPVLHKRLKEHARSIEQVSNLDLSDFVCRFLVVDDIWIPLGESLLIAQFSPLWNTTLDGFGIHDPGGGRRVQERSRWDVVHPGRPFADKQGPRKESAEHLMTSVTAQLRDQFD